MHIVVGIIVTIGIITGSEKTGAIVGEACYSCVECYNYGELWIDGVLSNDILEGGFMRRARWSIEHRFCVNRCM